MGDHSSKDLPLPENEGTSVVLQNLVDQHYEQKNKTRTESTIHSQNTETHSNLDLIASQANSVI